MQVRDFSPMKESLRTLVKVLIRNGMWSLFFPKERIHSYETREDTQACQVWFSASFWVRQVKHTSHKLYSTFRASKLRLISAVSTKVLRSLLLTSVPRSLPAKSTNENLPCKVLARSLRRSAIWRMAWEREELAFAEVWPDVLKQQHETQIMTHFSHVLKPGDLRIPVLSRRIKTVLFNLFIKPHASIPARTACLYHLDDIFCWGHKDLLQAHYLDLLFVILQHTELCLFVK